MSARRRRLENRRACESFAFECNGLTYLASVGRYADGQLAEVFLASTKAGSHSDAAAKDSAVLASLCLQHGVSVEVIRHALLRNADGTASSAISAALDIISKEQT